MSPSLPLLQASSPLLNISSANTTMAVSIGAFTDLDMNKASVVRNYQIDIADIKTILANNAISINNIIHSLSELVTKLGLQIMLPPPLPLFPATPTTLSTSATTAPPLLPPKPSLNTKPDAHSPIYDLIDTHLPSHPSTAATHPLVPSKTAASDNVDTSDNYDIHDKTTISINIETFNSIFTTPNKRVQPAAALLFPYSPTPTTSISHPFPQLFTPVTNPLCLSKPSFDTELETLSLNHYRTVVSIVRPDSRSNSNGTIFIDDVQITHQDLFIDGKIIIPDALSIIYPPSPFSCTTARPLSQIHSFLSTSLNDKVINWYSSLLDPIVVIFLPMDIVLDKEMKRLAGVKQKELLIGIWACLVRNKIYHQRSITFDPGGAFDMADIKKGDAVMLVLGLTTYDLEDKVYFEGKAMIRPAPYTGST